jgi:mannosyl-3-phosphoglycerate phosphatase
MRKVPLVTFVDIDTVPSPESLDRHAHARLLETLAHERIMLVFCSERTRAQMESTRQAFGVFHPFVCEGGAAAFVPERYFGSDLENSRRIGGYQAIEFGSLYEDVIETLRRVSERLNVGVMGFNDMSVEQVARECGLSLLEARLAKLREHGEWFRMLFANPVTERRLIRGLEAAGLNCRQGDPFHHVGTARGPGPAVAVLTTLYRVAFGNVMTACAGDGPIARDLAPCVDAPLPRRPMDLEEILTELDILRDARLPARAARVAR